MSRVFTAAVAMGLVVVVSALGGASDHADVPLDQTATSRPDLNWTDLYAFTVGSDLVLVGGIDARVPPGQTEYLFATDAEHRFIIDNAGDLSDPASISEEISINVTFDAVTDTSGVTRTFPTIMAHGYQGLAHQKNPANIRIFTGPRDDPFIRGPRRGRNVAAIVLQMPLADVVSPDRSVLRIWGTAETPRTKGVQVELNGRAMRSMQERQLNVQHPVEHAVEPDVVTFDTVLPTAFPNGRTLADDVVDRVPELGLVGQDVRNSEGCGSTLEGSYTNCHTTNDRAFLTDFPYLAPPH